MKSQLEPSKSSMQSIQNYLPFVMVALMLSICLGPSVKSIGVFLAVFVILFTPSYRRNLAFIFSKPVAIAAVGIFIIALIGCAWSIGSYTQQLVMLEKYSKLLYLPILAVGFTHKKTRFYGIQAFIFGMLITCIASIYKNYYVSGDPGEIFYNHIVTSYMMATAAYLAAWTAINIKSLPLKALYCLVTLLFSFQIIFVNSGRTGYVVFLMLFTLLFLQYFYNKWVRFTFLCFALFASLMIQHIHPQTLSNNIHMIMNDIYNYQHGERNTSLGIRLQFHRYAKLLFSEKPLLGQGTGSFSQRFHMDNPIPEWTAHPNPHSQYWLIASELGLLGLFALGCFYMILSCMSFRLNDMCYVSQAILLSFMVGNITDTFLVTSGIGYLFIAFMALCLGEFIEMRKQSKIIYNPPYPQAALQYFG